MGTFIDNVKSARNLDLASFVKKIVKLKLNLRYLAKSKQTLTCFFVLLEMMSFFAKTCWDTWYCVLLRICWQLLQLFSVICESLIHFSLSQNL